MIARILTLALAAGGMSCAGQQPSPPADTRTPAPTSGALVDTIFTLIRTKSVHRAGADWDAIESGFVARLADAPSFADSLAAFREVFAALGDVHSGIYHQGGQVSHFRSVSQEEAGRIRPLLERADAQRGTPVATVAAPGVGYLLVPSIFTSLDEMGRHAAEIREGLCRLHAAGASRWIVDLRLNTGGSMHPMLTGLGPLIGDGPIGGIVDADGGLTARWAIGSGRNLVNGEPAIEGTLPECSPFAGQPIAVLLGPVTMSSGQIVAVALAGRPATRSFGAATADGYTTANEWMALAEDLSLNLAVAYVADRTGRIYPRLVEPDEPVSGGDDFDDLARDATVSAALAWLEVVMD